LPTQNSSSEQSVEVELNAIVKGEAYGVRLVLNLGNGGHCAVSVLGSDIDKAVKNPLSHDYTPLVCGHSANLGLTRKRR
jgi:hypothetical protein